MTDDLPWRRPCVTEEVDNFSVTVSYDPRELVRGRIVPCEVFMSQRAKSGSELEEHQYELGVAASKLMQGELDSIPLSNLEVKHGVQGKEDEEVQERRQGELGLDEVSGDGGR